MDRSDEGLAWLRLALAEGVGPKITQRLRVRLGGVERAARAGLADLRAAAGPARARDLLEALRRARPEATCQAAADLGQRVLTPVDADWPSDAFAALPDVPLALFLRGRLVPPDRSAVAIVGTREAGHYGLGIARDLAEHLAREGLWIVSGLALGIDGAAHAGALAVAGGGTLAVLGCGLDVGYPVEHLELKEEIAACGGLLGELPPGTEPRPGHFPRRNRIVAALSSAVVVVEAPGRSGAIITAHRALEMGREVLAVPGPAGRASFYGSHRLIKRGEAALCENAGDVLQALGLDRAGEGAGASSSGRPRPTPPPSGAPLAVWGVIDEAEVVDADELCRRTGLGIDEVSTALATLEIDGRVARVPGLGVRRA